MHALNWGLSDTASMHETFVHGYDAILTSTQPRLPITRAMVMASHYAIILASFSFDSLDLAQIIGSAADASNGQPHVCNSSMYTTIHD